MKLRKAGALLALAVAAVTAAGCSAATNGDKAGGGPPSGPLVLRMASTPSGLNYVPAVADFARRVSVLSGGALQIKVISQWGLYAPGAEAQVIRLALIYALLDRCAVIDIGHLGAAIAVWEFCENSVRYIFGDALGDPIADEVLRALRHAGDAGMTRTQIRDLFARNRGTERVEVALGTLERHGKAKMISRDTGGRPAEVWISTVRAG